MADWNDRDDRWRDRDRNWRGDDNRNQTGTDFMTNQPRMSGYGEMDSSRGRNRGDESRYERQGNDDRNRWFGGETGRGYRDSNRDWDRDNDRMTWAGGGSYNRDRDAERDPWGSADYRYGSEYRGGGRDASRNWGENFDRPRSYEGWGGSNMNWGRSERDRNDWQNRDRESFWNRDRSDNRDDWRNRNVSDWNQSSYGMRDRGESGGGRWDQQRNYDESNWDRDRNRGWEAIGRDRSWSGSGTGYGSTSSGSNWDRDRDRNRFAGGSSGFDTQRDSGRDREWNRNRDWDSDRDRDRGESWTDKVANFFGVGPKNWQRSDDKIREEVSEALEQDPRVDASNIEVNVQNGEVTLTGNVPQRHMKRWAEDVAERCRGVRDVHNQVRATSDYGRGTTQFGQTTTGVTSPGTTGVAATGGIGTADQNTDKRGSESVHDRTTTGTRRNPAA